MPGLKQIVHIALAMLLLTATAGVAVSKHYCLDHLHSVAIYAEATSCTGESDHSMPCCEEVVDLLKVDTYTSVEFDFDFVQYQVAQIHHGFEMPGLSPLNKQLQANSEAQDLPPPDRRVLLQVFRL